MPSDLQVSNLKALDGTAGISIADSTGRVSFTETNPSLTLGSNATFPSGFVIKTEMFSSSASITQESSGIYTNSAITSGSFSHASGSKILIIANCMMATSEEGWVIKVNGATSGPELEFYNGSDNTQIDTTTYAFLDSPSGTSTTYTVQFKRNSSGTATFYNANSKLILMEVKG